MCNRCGIKNDKIVDNKIPGSVYKKVCKECRAYLEKKYEKIVNKGDKK